jgi:hypothetical protein
MEDVMDNKPIFFLPLLIVLAISGCSESVKKTFPYIEGSLTVEPGINRLSIEIGLFYRTTVEANSSMKIDLDGLEGRLYYIDRDNSSHSIEITPARRGYIVGNTRDRFFINLPDPPVAQTEGEYYLTAWYDSDGDGRLDLMTENIPAGCETELGNAAGCTGVALIHAHEGEYNRVPVKNMVVTSTNGGYTSEATDVYLGYLNNDTEDNYQFKYYGVVNFFSDADEEVLTEVNNSGFNFTISDTVDSN